jgi:hypothetical protein
MHGIAEEDAVVGVWQPVNMAAMPMAENTASKERSCAFMFCGESGLIKIERICPVKRQYRMVGADF